MGWLILGIILLILYWFFHTDHSLDVDFYAGRKGCGKTATLAAFSIEYFKKGMKVYTNVPGISNTLYFNPKQLDDRKPAAGSVALLDEVSLVWSNRDFRDFRAEEFFRYCRQYKVKVIMFSQTFDVDLKIRSLVDRIFLMTRIGKVVLYRPVIKKLGVVQRPDGTGDLQDTFAYGSILGWKLRYLPRYYGLFQTFNPPKRIDVDAVLTKCTAMFTHYRTTGSWLLYRSLQMKEELSKQIGIYSTKYMPVLTKKVSDLWRKHSNGSARVTNLNPLVEVSLADYLFWLQ